jgi:hypothetical protein
MLWSPYWGTENLKEAACVIHRTNIFDYAVIQPHYYFSPDYSAHLNCEALRTGIAIQRVVYQTGQPILHESAITCTKTVIGCQMEIDNNYTPTNAYGKRYQKYVDVFDASEGAYSKATTNFGFYFECPWEENDESYNTIRDEVNKFFK